MMNDNMKKKNYILKQTIEELKATCKNEKYFKISPSIEYIVSQKEYDRLVDLILKL